MSRILFHLFPLFMRLALILVPSCASSPIGQLRFHNRPPVWRVNDRQPIKKPKQRIFAHFLYVNDAYVFRRLPRAMELRAHRRALGVNSIDEVPDSTWFTNRIGLREMSVEEVRRGPNSLESPEKHKPWIVLGTKVGGSSAGFIIKDQRGIRFLLKFDEKNFPEMETAADIIVQRILYACGYNVPEDMIVTFKKNDLVMAKDAKVEDFYGNKGPMKKEHLENNLQRVNIGADGTIRGMLSRFLPGVPIGGISLEGTRKDDPNDNIPHDLRRDLRGQVAIFSWLHHTDIKEDNSLDMWAEDPKKPGHHYVVHYLLDFGKALGVMGHIEKRKQVAFSHSTDMKYFLKTLPSFGFWVRPWEEMKQPEIPGIGLIDVKSYRPDLYTTNLPYYPFYESDRFDGFWGAKILIRFTPEQIRAVVEQGRYSDTRAIEYMTKVLLQRQKITARYWFKKVNPLDRFIVSTAAREHRLCFDDLMIRYKLEQGVSSSTSYTVSAYDYDGEATGWNVTARPEAKGRVCICGFSLPTKKDGYLVIQIHTAREGSDYNLVNVHLAKNPANGRPWVIGLRRY